MAAWAVLPIGLAGTGIAIAVGSKLRDIPWKNPMWLIPAVIGTAGLGVLFVAVRRLVNVTSLKIEPGRLSLRHGPLPWWQTITLATDSIRQVEVRPITSRYNGTAATHYQVWAVQDRDRETCLLDCDAARETANFVCEEIQRCLKD